MPGELTAEYEPSGQTWHVVSVVAVPIVPGKQLPNLSSGGTTDIGAVEQPFAGQHSKTANLGSDKGGGRIGGCQPAGQHRIFSLRT